MTFVNRLKPILIAKHNEQRGRCAYCYQPLWIKPLEPQGMAILRMKFIREEKTSHTSSLGWLVGEADHIIPTSEGGTDEPNNILAACNYCNRKRDKMPVVEWFRYIQSSQFLISDEGAKLNHILYVEMPAKDVRPICTEVLKGDFQVQENTAVTFLLYWGSTVTEDREYVWKNRKNIFGARIGVQSLKQRDLIADRLRPHLYEGPLA